MVMVALKHMSECTKAVVKLRQFVHKELYLALVKKIKYCFGVECREIKISIFRYTL